MGAKSPGDTEPDFNGVNIRKRNPRRTKDQSTGRSNMSVGVRGSLIPQSSILASGDAECRAAVCHVPRIFFTRLVQIL